MAQGWLKPTGILAPNESNPLWGNITNCIVFGDEIKDLKNPSHVIATDAPVVQDPYLGSCCSFQTNAHGVRDETDSQNILTKTVPMTDGAGSVVFVMRVVNGVRGDAVTRIDLLYRNSSSERLELYLYAGREFISKFEWGNGGVRTFETPELPDQQALNDFRCVGVSWDTANGIAGVTDGDFAQPLTNTSVETSGVSAETEQLELIRASSLPAAANGIEYRIAAVLVFDVALPLSTLLTESAGPYHEKIIGDPVLEISIEDDAITGQALTLPIKNGVGPFTATYAGHNIDLPQQTANSITFPEGIDLTKHGDLSTPYLTEHEFVITDTGAEDATASVHFPILPQGQWLYVSGYPFPNTSFLFNTAAQNGDKVYCYWESGGDDFEIPNNCDMAGAPLSLGEHVLKAVLFYDQGSGIQTYYDPESDGEGNISTLTFNIEPPTIAFKSAKISGDGLTLTVELTEEGQIGAGGLGDMIISMSNGPVTATYLEGDGTLFFKWNLSRPIKDNEVGHILDYTNPVDGLESVADGTDAPNSFNFEIKNESGVPAIVPAVTTQPTNQLAEEGSAPQFTAAFDNATTIQWYDALTDTPLDGETGATLTINNVTIAEHNGLDFYAIATSADNKTIKTNTVSLEVIPIISPVVIRANNVVNIETKEPLTAGDFEIVVYPLVGFDEILPADNYNVSAGGNIEIQTTDYVAGAVGTPVRLAFNDADSGQTHIYESIIEAAS